MIEFYKIQGSGNDFILIDNRENVLREVGKIEAFVKTVCAPHVSVGADGLIVIEASDRAHFRWRFFNADGSEAEMCGNGARCVARFAYMNGLAAARMRFETLAGIIDASVADTQVTIRMPAPHTLQLDLEIETAGRRMTGHSVNTGVPHLVVFVDDLETVDVDGQGRELRCHPRFAPAGTNVNFVDPSGDALAIRTYERGVEAETMACGTGATAAAVVAVAKGLASSPVRLRTRGGVELGVQFSGDGASAEHVLLRGPAHLVYRGELTAEALVE